MKVSISSIKIGKDRRPVDENKVKELAGSMGEVGLINAVTITTGNALIAGAHRIEAAKLLGWTEIEANPVGITGLKAKLAEIDENLIRNELHYTERGDLLLERKQIYEGLHPETKAGKSQADGMNRAQGNNVSAESAPTFVKDTANKTGSSSRVIHEEIQISKSLAPEVKETIRKHDIPKTDALKLARMEPEQQRAVAAKIDSGKAITVDEAAGRAKSVAYHRALDRVAEYRKTGIKPKGWIDGEDDELNRKADERDARLDAYSQETADKKDRQNEGGNGQFIKALHTYLNGLANDDLRIGACNAVMRECRKVLGKYRK